MIRGAIFDIDGVILDSMEIWGNLGARYLKSMGKKPENDLGAILFPMSIGDGVSYLKAKYEIKKTNEEIMLDFNRLLHDFYFYEARQKQGARELLQYLHDKKIPSAAATSTPRTLVTAALQRMDLLKFFVEIFTADEMSTDKHSPQIYLAAARKLRTQPHETAVFEDTLFAAKTAKSAGFIIVCLYDKYSDKDKTELKKTADCYITSLTESAAFFEE